MIWRLVAALVVAWPAASVAWSVPAATIGGAEVVSMADLEAAAGDVETEYQSAMARCRVDAERGRHDGRDEVLRKLVRARLMAMEVERLDVTAEVFDARIHADVAPVTDDDVAAFYREYDLQEPLSEVAPEIRDYLEREAHDVAHEAAMVDLERRYAVEYLVDPLRYVVSASIGYSVGPADAPVTIVEFSDFECPYCARLLPTLERLRAEYTGKVRIIYRHYPLTSIHPYAWKAAEAALCAGEQGRFWELHDLMFADQDDLSVTAIKALVGLVGPMDTVAFDACLDSGRYSETVAADVRAGDALGVSGTPALFVNGRPLSGAVPFTELAAVVDDELRRAGLCTSVDICTVP